MQKRLIVSFVLIMFLTLALSYSMFLNIYATRIIEIIKQNLYNDAEQIIYISETRGNINDYVEKYIENTGNDILIIKDGEPINTKSGFNKEIYDNLKDEISVGDRAELIKVEGNDRLIAISVSSEVGNTSVFISASYNKVAAFDANEWAYLFIIFIVCIAISTILWYRFIFYNTRSIRTITQVVNEIANGNYSETIRYEYDDEIGKLVKAFNYMASKLQSTMGEMHDRNSKLEAVLKSIINGVIAIDNHGRIILINDSAREILDIKDADVMDKHLLEVIRNYKLSQSLDDYINNRTDIDMEFEINLPQSKTLKVYINPIINSEFPDRRIGSVIVFNDITELKKLERIRSDFVANVSHELRTPLTSIMGFVETLKEGNVRDEATLNKFLDIISLETERLTRLINDILTLSEIENVKEDIKREYLSLKNEIKDVIYILSNKAYDKNIKINLSVVPDDLGIFANKDRLRQLFINLIDNAIKYNKEDGYVWIKAWKENHNINISVKDTGIGIGSEHLPRIFERFYRVNKGRSRDLGGTGLGLAIVKHIVESMNGNIEISSVPGSGTEFLIILKD